MSIGWRPEMEAGKYLSLSQPYPLCFLRWCAHRSFATDHAGRSQEFP
jgi:hypothetical protein